MYRWLYTHCTVAFGSFITNTRGNQLILILEEEKGKGCREEGGLNIFLIRSNNYYAENTLKSLKWELFKETSVSQFRHNVRISLCYERICRGTENESLIWHSVFRSHSGAHTPSQAHLPVSWEVGGIALGLRCCGLKRDKDMAVPCLKGFFNVQTCFIKILQVAGWGLQECVAGFEGRFN